MDLAQLLRELADEIEKEGVWNVDTNLGGHRHTMPELVLMSKFEFVVALRKLAERIKK